MPVRVVACPAGLLFSRRSRSLPVGTPTRAPRLPRGRCPSRKACARLEEGAGFLREARRCWRGASTSRHPSPHAAVDSAGESYPAHVPDDVQHTELQPDGKLARGAVDEPPTTAQTKTLPTRPQQYQQHPRVRVVEQAREHCVDQPALPAAHPSVAAPSAVVRHGDDEQAAIPPAERI